MRVEGSREKRKRSAAKEKKVSGGAGRGKRGQRPRSVHARAATGPAVSECPAASTYLSGHGLGHDARRQDLEHTVAVKWVR